jgi:hypothetical protein
LKYSNWDTQETNMTTLPISPTPDEPKANVESQERARPAAAIRDGVLAALGRPPGFYRATVTPLWLNYYRVNVFVGSDPTAVEIAHSYFVSADGTGRVLTATPPLTRLYR